MVPVDILLDTEENIFKVEKKAFLILAILAVTVTSPLAVRVPSSSDHQSRILTLDICNTGGYALSADNHMSAITASPGRGCLLECDGFNFVADIFFTPFLTSFQQDRPPEA
jgi:hypothetical protein